MPKIELHCHLDGSLRPETVLELIPKSDLQSIRSQMIVPDACDSLVTYLERFKLPVQLMQTKEVLSRVSYELMEDAYHDGVKYIEIRFAPELHTLKGLSEKEIIEAVLEGIRDGEKAFEIRGNLILSYLRHSAIEGLERLIEVGKDYLNQGVVAIDLCGAEEKGFCEPYRLIFHKARALGFRVTIHAGETGFHENIIEAIQWLGAERIGHGVAMMNHPETKRLVQEKNIGIECCPTSNLQTKAIKKINHHPINDFYKEGLKVSFNTDNRTVSNTTMTQEYQLIKNTFHWEDDYYQNIFKQSVEMSFADETTKKWLLSFL